MLFKKTTVAEEITPLTKEDAQKIYVLFAEGKSHTDMFLRDNIPFVYSKLVWDEIQGLQNETVSRAAGTYIITPAIPEERDENNKVTQEFVPPVMYIPTTQADMEKEVVSDLVNTKTLIADCVKYVPTYEDKRNWNEFLDALKTEM